MTVEPAQDDRRPRRRGALLWFGAALAFVLVAVTSVAAWNALKDPSPNLASAQDGNGRAPVLAAPPPGYPPVVAPSSTASATAAPTHTSGSGATSSGGSRSVVGSRTDQAAGGPVRTHGEYLILTSMLDQPLRPGFRRTLHVSVRNPNYFPVQLYRLDVRVGVPPAVGCLPKWIRTGRYRYAGTSLITVGARATSIVDLSMELVDLPTVNQNSCQNTVFPLTLSGVAVDPT